MDWACDDEAVMNWACDDEASVGSTSPGYDGKCASANPLTQGSATIVESMDQASIYVMIYIQIEYYR